MGMGVPIATLASGSCELEITSDEAEADRVRQASRRPKLRVLLLHLEGNDDLTGVRQQKICHNRK